MNIKQFFQSKVFILLFAASFSMLATSNAFAQDDSTEVATPVIEEPGESYDKDSYKRGEEIFEGECTTCHALDSKVVGPALRNVGDRRENAWIKKWIKNSAALIASGDEQAIAVFEEHGKAAMAPFPFKDSQIDDILVYVKNGPKPPAPVEPVPCEGPNCEDEKENPVDDTLIIMLSAVLGVLLLILIILVFMSATLTKRLKTKSDELSDIDNEVVNQKHEIKKVLTHPAFIGGVAVIAILIGLWLGIVKGLYWVGTQGGYAPKQPIEFSHVIHAGEDQIDCNYCHTGVRKAKNANIPSPNICMNCHSRIKTDSKEIAKIYEALDYDPKTKIYGPNQKPIEWIRIHNLPDLAYFNHSQHVKVGGIECQECHGPVQEMERVYQYSELTMGWCINCHRKTEVNAKGNAYYDELLKLHNEANEGEPMTVEDIGGLECSKCHY